ncbi:MAG TPA: VWA domain-containing protein [Thermoanaerobaculia bacterium]|nr:VWA domain-containing protein [Thermoanaerobaculia bacterium]
MKLSRALDLSLLALLLAAAGASGQDYGETVDVNVVTVDVEVRDAHGRQVTDLGRDDFQVFEDGKRVKVAYYERVVGHRMGGESAAAAAGGAPGTALPDTASWIVVYVDNLQLRPDSREQAIEHLRRTFREAVPGERVMVVSQDASFHVRLPFSTDRAAIDAALAALETLPAEGATKERQRSQALASVVAAQRDALALELPCGQAVAEPARAYAEVVQAEVEGTVGRLLAFTNTLAGLPGRKALLYVSDGMPMRPGQDALQAVTELCRGDSQQLAARGFPAYSAALEAASMSVAEQLRRLTAHANAQRVSFYPLQASGLGTTGTAAAVGLSRGDRGDRLLQLAGVSSVAEHNLSESLLYLGNETGGRAIIGTNDFAPELDRLRADLATFYSLGYIPEHQGDGKEHSIEVRVARPGLKLAYRRGYRDKPALEQTADRTLAALLHGYEENPLEVKLELAPAQPLPNGRFRVVARLLVPLGKLGRVSRADAYEAKLRVIAATGDRTGESRGLRQVQVPVRIPVEEALTAFGQSYAYDVGLELEAGEHTLAFAVRDELGGTASFLRRTVTVGPPATP